MELHEAIRNRACARRFTGEEVADSVINNLLDSAIHAPTAGNLQPWRFYVVRDKTLKERLAGAAFGQSFVAQAPVVIVVCADLGVCARGYGARGETLYAVQDTAAAVENILLTAVAEGLGACWVGAFNEDAASGALGLSEGTRPLALVPVGHPVSEPVSPGREDFEKFTTYL